MGKNTCSSSPKEARGCQLDPLSTVRFWEKLSRCAPRHCPLTGSTEGQPNGTWFSDANCPLLIFNCDDLSTGSTPKSTNGAMATGPAIVIRYSALLTRLKSP